MSTIEQTEEVEKLEKRIGSMGKFPYYFFAASSSSLPDTLILLPGLHCLSVATPFET